MLPYSQAFFLRASFDSKNSIQRNASGSLLNIHYLLSRCGHAGHDSGRLPRLGDVALSFGGLNLLTRKSYSLPTLSVTDFRYIKSEHVYPLSLSLLE